MSTLKTVNIQHPSSASVNAGTDTSGNFLMNSGYGSVATAYGCRAWVNFDGTGTVGTNQTIRASGGVTSVYKNATGSYTVNLSFSLPSATNYAVVCTASNYGALTQSLGVGQDNSNNIARTASSVSVSAQRVNDSVTATVYDPAWFTVAIFR